MTRRRIHWLLLPITHAVVFSLAWFLYQWLFIEIHPLAATGMYVVGVAFTLALLAALMPGAMALLGMLFGRAPSPFAGCLLGTISGLLASALFRLWPLVSTPKISNVAALLIQNAVATIIAIGAYSMYRHARESSNAV